MLNEMNRARTNPKSFADDLEQRLPLFEGKLYIPPDGSPRLRTKEGPAAVREAIDYLRSAAPLAPLGGTCGLSSAAEAHVMDQGPSGRTGHDGTDGSSLSDRVERFGRWRGAIGENIQYGSTRGHEVVLSLIVDDGVPSRGHRENIFARKFKLVGIACGPHKKYGHMCVTDFAAGFNSKR